MIELVLATHNAGKIAEMRRLLDDLPTRLVCLSELGVSAAPDETGADFAANATLKGRYYARRVKRWTLSEDSGLEVDALDGAPGVYSARYGGADLSDAERCQLVLRRLKNAPPKRRAARFRAVAVLCAPDGELKAQASGVLEGAIAAAPFGENGFGYDPIFEAAEFGTTTAALPPETKNRISHRGKALRALRPHIRRCLNLREAPPR